MFTKTASFAFRLFNAFMFLTLLIGTLGGTSAHAAGIRYAKPAVSGTGDCITWVNACTLQTALTGAISGDEIWAAAGTYKPTALGTDRVATFQLLAGVAIYGGFAGIETARDQRSPAINVTILSGDIDNNDSQTPIITNLSTVTGNTTNSYHVVTGVSGATLDGFTVTAGNANNGSYCPSAGCGGGMSNWGGNPLLMNLTFSGNTATQVGGGMYNSTGGNPTLTNVTFDGNSATVAGGGMGNNGTAVLSNVTFSGNSAGFGGGMYNFPVSTGDRDLTLTNVTFSGNLANNGGGMGNSIGAHPMLTDVTFNDNIATNDGGGMYNSSSSPTLNNVTFSINSVAHVPAFTVRGSGGGMYNTNSSPTLMNVTFSSNDAGGGGGMYNKNSSSPMLTNVAFNNNSAYSYDYGVGGGMFNSSSSNPTLTNITFSGNEANYSGGLYNLNSNPTLTNVTFSDNSAYYNTGGMGNATSSPILTNVTFNGNSSYQGGGMSNFGGSSPEIRNTIFWANTADTVEAQIYNESSTPVVSDSVVQDGCPAGSTCTNIITTDPKLGTLGYYGGFTPTISLLAGSSAIDTGNDSVCPATDQRGVSRPQGAHCDIGSYELVDTISIVYDLFLPLILR